MKTTLLITLLLIFLPTSCQAGLSGSSDAVPSVQSSVSSEASNTESGQTRFIVDNSENPIHIQIEGQTEMDTVDGKGTTTNGIVRSAENLADYGSCFDGIYPAEKEDKDLRYTLMPIKPQQYGLLTLGVEYDELRMEATFLHGKSVSVLYDRSIELTGAKDEFEFLFSGKKLKGMVFANQCIHIAGQLSKTGTVSVLKDKQKLILQADTTIEDLTVTLQTPEGKTVATCCAERSGSLFQITVKNGQVKIFKK